VSPQMTGTDRPERHDNRRQQHGPRQHGPRPRGPDAAQRGGSARCARWSIAVGPHDRRPHGSSNCCPSFMLDQNALRDHRRSTVCSRQRTRRILTSYDPIRLISAKRTLMQGLLLPVRGQWRKSIVVGGACVFSLQPCPALSGGDRKALKKELSKSRAMTRIFAERSRPCSGRFPSRTLWASAL